MGSLNHPAQFSKRYHRQTGKIAGTDGRARFFRLRKHVFAGRWWFVHSRGRGGISEFEASLERQVDKDVTLPLLTQASGFPLLPVPDIWPPL